MTSKTDRTPADATKTEHDRREPTSIGLPPQAKLVDPASADIWFFETPLAFAYGHGMGSVTLTTRRQLVDPSGQVFEDAVITGLLRAPLASLQHLKLVIIEIEKLAERAAANAIASIAPQGGGLPN